MGMNTFTGIIFTLYFGGALAQSTCTEGTIHNGDCWTLDTTSLTWMEARDNCTMQYEGRLAELFDSDDTDFVTDLMTDNGVSIVWLGGYESVFSDWQWVTGNEGSYSYTWDTSSSQSGSCVLVQAGNNYKFEEESCGTQKRYVCEIRISSESECPTSTSGYEYYARYCFFGSRGSNRLSWFDAATDCETKNGTLLVMETESMYDFMKFVFGETSLISTEKYWIGLHKAGWAWDSGLSFTYSNWKSYSQPDNDDHNCLAVRQDLSYQWADEDCASTYKSICVTGVLYGNETEPTTPEYVTTEEMTTEPYTTAVPTEDPPYELLLSVPAIILICILIIVVAIAIALLVLYCKLKKETTISPEKEKQLIKVEPNKDDSYRVQSTSPGSPMSISEEKQKAPMFHSPRPITAQRKAERIKTAAFNSPRAQLHREPSNLDQPKVISAAFNTPRAKVGMGVEQPMTTSYNSSSKVKLVSLEERVKTATMHTSTSSRHDSTLWDDRENTVVLNSSRPSTTSWSDAVKTATLHSTRAETATWEERVKAAGITLPRLTGNAWDKAGTLAPLK